jgi:hypothetical protein
MHAPYLQQLRFGVFLSILGLAAATALARSPEPQQGPVQNASQAAKNADVPVVVASDIAAIKADLAKIAARKRSFRDPDVWLPFAAALLVAIGGWATTLYVFRKSQSAQQAAFSRQSAERIEDNLLNLLKLFGGGSQNRSLGLALVTAYRNTDLPAIQRAWKNVLVAQAIYLLTQSEERDNLLEVENLRVIMSRLEERRGDLSPGQRSNLIEALSRAEGDPRGKITKDHPSGLPLGVTTNADHLASWKTMLAA